MANNDDFFTKYLDLNCIISEQIQSDICRWLYSIKFDSYAYIITPRQGNDELYILNGFNPLWRRQYTEYQFHKIDPIITKARNYLSPSVWSSVSLSINDRFLNCAKNHGIRFGYSVSLPLNDDYICVLSIARKDDDFISRKDSVMIIGMMTIYLQDLNNAVRPFLWAEKRGQVNMPVLTKRELECLRWLAEGKTNWEISKILSISERTVIFHINNCMSKLDAKNRVQVVTNAIRAKIIE